MDATTFKEVSMGLLSLFGSSFGLWNREAQVARYHRLRSVLIGLGNHLVGQLEREAILKGARALGMLHGRQIYFSSPDESSVLMDYCVYDVLRNQRNIVEEYVSDCPPEPGTDKAECLRAMLRARYSILLVLDANPGVGCEVRDLLTGKEHWLADMGLSATGSAGMLLATRVLDFGEFIVTGGAALPLAQLPVEQSAAYAAKLGQGLEDLKPAEIIRWAIEHGHSEHIAYGDLEDVQAATEDEPQDVNLPAPVRPSDRKNPKLRQPSANRRCRCGSGKMFKNCCGRKAR
jgi:hypothetical protein